MEYNIDIVVNKNITLTTSQLKRAKEKACPFVGTAKVWCGNGDSTPKSYFPCPAKEMCPSSLDKWAEDLIKTSLDHILGV